MSQAEARAWRIGQKEQVLVQYLVVENSFGSALMKQIIKKAEIADRALDRESETSELISTIDSNITKVLAKVKPPKCSKGDSNGSNGNSDSIPELTLEQIQAIHTMLKILAGSDMDHAQELNDIGFNKFDGAIGHSLAQTIELTQKQAQLGKKIILKYKRQLPEDLYELTSRK
jgi:hypothetical protein